MRTWDSFTTVIDSAKINSEISSGNHAVRSAFNDQHLQVTTETYAKLHESPGWLYYLHDKTVTTLTFLRGSWYS